MNRERLRRAGGRRSRRSSHMRLLIPGSRIGFLRCSIACLFRFRSACSVTAPRPARRVDDTVARGIAREVEQLQDLTAEAKKFRTVSLTWTIQGNKDSSFDLAW